MLSIQLIVAPQDYQFDQKHWRNDCLLPAKSELESSVHPLNPVMKDHSKK